MLVLLVLPALAVPVPSPGSPASVLASVPASVRSLSVAPLASDASHLTKTSLVWNFLWVAFSDKQLAQRQHAVPWQSASPEGRRRKNEYGQSRNAFPSGEDKTRSTC